MPIPTSVLAERDHFVPSVCLVAHALLAGWSFSPPFTLAVIVHAEMASRSDLLLAALERTALAVAAALVDKGELRVELAQVHRRADPVSVGEHEAIGATSGSDGCLVEVRRRRLGTDHVVALRRQHFPNRQNPVLIGVVRLAAGVEGPRGARERKVIQLLATNR